MSNPTAKQSQNPEWVDVSGQPIACSEKNRVLHESLHDAVQAAQTALDDAVLMGCAAQDYQARLLQEIAALRPSVKERAA